MGLLRNNGASLQLQEGETVKQNWKLQEQNKLKDNIFVFVNANVECERFQNLASVARIKNVRTSKI